MSIYQHFREEEHPFIDQVLSWRETVERTYQAKLTDFLDPREQQIVSSLIGTKHADVQLAFQDTGEQEERKRAFIAPFYEEITETSFQLSLLQATFHTKFIQIEHRDVLGAFTSLGITREKLGDIFIDEGVLQLIVAEEIAPYVVMNLTTIKNARISLDEKPLSSMLTRENNWKASDQTVSSLRLDVVLKEIYRIPRKEAQQFIKKKRVKVNFKIVTDLAFDLYEGDLISVRGKGRSKLLQVNGRTRKDKLRITTAILK